ncbi:unnamed protein product [Acanthoscelides obtectus]|uniref:Uncharacterized protein n=1 Tax=Acanthoscelides obtectus TaxID=200917 RepID=A0A9P0P135_ACAOB|nr:unnamed protein product [Acanthoscelides obtectus]CAK1632037.1 hypothetical protein AOBTE_LOCUS7317 [Acanthoscelides obtectus]
MTKRQDISSRRSRVRN